MIERIMIMNLTHIHAFTQAMQRKDLDAMLSHMADDIVLKTPLAAEPFTGKAAIRPVVTALLGVVDSFDFHEVLQGPNTCPPSSVSPSERNSWMASTTGV
jgi:limonene-1,2-epoxide hydrolase